MIGHGSEAGTIEDHRAPDPVLGVFQLTNDLLHRHLCILVLEYLGEVDLHGLQALEQRPGIAARLEEIVVDLEPGGLVHHDWRGRCRLTCVRITGQGGIELGLADGVGQPLSQATEAFTDHLQIGGQVVRAGIELTVVFLVIGEPSQVPLQPLDSIAVFRLGRGEDPGLGIVIEFGLSVLQIDILHGLGLGPGEIIPQGAGQVAQFGQGTEFPVRDVVQVETGRGDVVAQIAAGLIQQGLGNPDGGGRGHAAGNQLGRVVADQCQGLLPGVEGCGRAGPIDPQDHDDHQIGYKEEPGGPPQALLFPGSGVVDRHEFVEGICQPRHSRCQSLVHLGLLCCSHGALQGAAQVRCWARTLDSIFNRGTGRVGNHRVRPSSSSRPGAVSPPPAAQSRKSPQSAWMTAMAASGAVSVRRMRGPRRTPPTP